MIITFSPDFQCGNLKSLPALYSQVESKATRNKCPSPSQREVNGFASSKKGAAAVKKTNHPLSNQVINSRKSQCFIHLNLPRKEKNGWHLNSNTWTHLHVLVLLRSIIYWGKKQIKPFFYNKVTIISTLIYFFFLSAVRNNCVTSLGIPQVHVPLNLQGVHEHSQRNSSIFWEAVLPWPGREGGSSHLLPGYQRCYQRGMAQESSLGWCALAELLKQSRGAELTETSQRRN